MNIKDVKVKSWYATTINHREQIQDLVSPDFVDICEYLYDLNVPICMHSGWGKSIFLVIDYDLLSKENRQVLFKLAEKIPNNLVKGNFSPLAEHNEVKIEYPIAQAESVEDFRNFFWKVAKHFKMQDVQSYIDEERFIKNVYTIPDILSRYFFCERSEALAKIKKPRDFVESEEIENFLHSLGYKKVKSSEITRATSLKGRCENVWIDNNIDQSHFADSDLYAVLNANREALFGDRPMSIENLNLNEILRVMNTSSTIHYGEQYTFNPQDKRFYLNEELLDKHNRYLQVKQNVVDEEMLSE